MLLVSDANLVKCSSSLCLNFAADLWQRLKMLLISVADLMKLLSIEVDLWWKSSEAVADLGVWSSRLISVVDLMKLGWSFEAAEHCCWSLLYIWGSCWWSVEILDHWGRSLRIPVVDLMTLLLILEAAQHRGGSFLLIWYSGCRSLAAVVHLWTCWIFAVCWPFEAAEHWSWSRNDNLMKLLLIFVPDLARQLRIVDDDLRSCWWPLWLILTTTDEDVAGLCC